ncbi:MAG: hypothetical protein H6702_14850 [Myxococcales bacterium]|nr:hypothetical protein [Myxococcales bacterium]
MSGSGTTAREPRWVVALKGLLLGAAALLYLWPMATRPGLIAGLVGLAAGVGVARLVEPRRLRTWAGGALAVGLGLFAFPLGGALLNSTTAGDALAGRTLLVLADGLQWGLAAFALGFGLRFLAARARPLAVLEAAFVVGSVAYTFARHRDHMIAQPRFFADWAWSLGYDPTIILMALGVAVAAVATLLLLREQHPAKLAITALMLLLLGLAVYQLMGFVPVEVEPFTNGLGLTDNPGDGGGDGKDGDGKGGQGNDKDGKGGGANGKGDSNSKNNSSGGGAGGGAPPPPVPVAVAIFNDDYDPPGGIYYFRQQVLSRFDGTKLVADDAGRFDHDVITEFPERGPIEVAKDAPNPDFHTRVPTTMFLLHDHPQPVGLSQSIRVEPHDNPAPRRFVAAYSVVSQTLSTGLDRFLGRASVDPTWSPSAGNTTWPTPTTLATPRSPPRSCTRAWTPASWATTWPRRW